MIDSDLPIFFEHHQDPVANHMAAFTAKDPADEAAFAAHWAKIRANGAIVIRTVVFQGRVAGHIVRFEQFGHPEISYWIGRAYWGQGIATAALSQFLEYLKERPLYARAVQDNVASLRVLQKCGFTIFATDKGFANARGEEVEEYILIRNG